MIPVTKPYLPSREKLDRHIDGIYERQWLTNNGQLVQELTRRSEVLILDEATSALDGITEKLIMDAIHDFSGKKQSS